MARPNKKGPTTDATVGQQSEAEIRQLNFDLEQRVAERTAALEASERRMRAVLGAAVDAIVTIDGTGTIETFNAGAERMFGYTTDEAVGENVRILMGSPYCDQHDDYLERYRETREPRVIGRPRELCARRKDGTEFPIQLSVSEIPELGIFMGIVRDITEQRALQDEIVRIASLEQQRIGEELHDGTQQELTGLGLLAESLREALSDHGSDRESKLAARLAAGIAKANRRVRDLAKGLVPVPIEAGGLMSALDALAHDTEETSGILCRFECPHPVQVADDSTALHLYRIAQEAVTNAIKHANPSTISIRLVNENHVLTCQVVDDGIGINETRDFHKGLGVRIMEHRCNLIGGKLTLHRRATGGTTVSCEIQWLA
jgi:two-component system sensor kinase FixL